MAGSIKGITIEFRGDTTKLDKALRQINNETRAIDKELKNVDKALKFNPTSVELWRQKQDLLNKKLKETNEKADLIRETLKKVDSGEIEMSAEDVDKLKRELIETESKAKTFEAQLKQIGNVNLKAASEQFKEWGNNLESAGQKMKGISTAAAGLVASLGAISYKAGTAADDLNTLSKVTGISTDNLQKYSYAADLVDVSVDAIAKSNKKLAKNAYEAANGSKSQVEAFDALGVSVTDSNGELRDSEDIFQDVISALGQMSNETERDALAQKLMGKSASELNPLIEDGGETYKMVADTMKKYDLDYVDQETLNKANEFNDALDTMKLLGSVAFAQVGSQLSAYLAPALEKVVGLVGKFANWLSQLNPKVLAVVGAVAAFVAALAPMLILLGKVAFGISSILNLASTLGVSFAALAGPIGIAVAAIAAIIAIGVLLYKNWDTIKKYAKDLANNLKKIWTNIQTAITTAVTAIKNVITTIFTAISTYILTVLTAWKTAITTTWTAINLVITTILTAIKTAITMVWTAISLTISTIVNAIKTTITTVFNAIKTTISTVLNAIKSTASSVWDSIKSSVSEKASAIKTKLSDTWSSIKSSASDAWKSIKDKITSPFESAKETISNIVSKIKGMFPISIGRLFKGLELPHFSLQWSSKDFGVLGTVNYPSGINVSWWAKGGIFDSPSVIGVGENGAEAVVPLDKFWDKLDNMSAGETVINININGSNKDPREIAEEVKRVLIREVNNRRLAWQ